MIEFKNLSFHYGGEHGTGEGVDHIDLRIDDGEFVVLCGRSGCGKTTLTRLINGLAPQFFEGPLEGSVTVNGRNVSTKPLSSISTLVGSVFQNPKSQFFNIDTTSELVFGCENQGLERAEIAQRLEQTVNDMQLQNLLDRNIFELAGGEKQQIACGSVYASRPEVFVLDEPSSNLDKKAIWRLRKILERIKQSGKTVVISEHRLYYLMDLADRFIYMEDGYVRRDIPAAKMRALSDDELKSMGLRCTDLSRLEKSRENPDAQPGGRPAIEGLDISCNRGNTKILDVERLTLPENSVVALIGDNGCGKSTLAETLCGVIPGSGSVAFGGEYLTDKQRARRSFMVMQDVNRQLFSESVIEELTLNAAADRDRAMELLEELDLSGQAERHPASLSGGQKQRVAIASALCAGKEIIFCDEPTSGLDRGGMENFGRLLRSMRDRLRCTVIITHDPELVLECCTHVMHIENGRVMAFYPLDREGTERVLYYFLSPSDESSTKKRENLSAVGKILKYTGSYRKYTFAAIALMLLGAASSVIPYLSVYRLIDQLVQRQPLSGIAAAIAVVLLGELGYAVFYSLGLKYSHKAAYGTLENIRCSLQEKMELQALGDIQELGSGAVKKLFIDDVESIEALLAHMLPEGIANLVVPLIVLLVLAFADWQLALVTIITIMFGAAASTQMYSVGMDRMGSYFAASKRLNNSIIEYVNGMEVVRVFNRQGEVGQNFADTVKSYRDFALAWYRVCWPWMAAYGSIFANIAFYTIPFGAMLILLGQLSLSRYILCLCLCFAIGPQLMHLMSFLGLLPQVNFKIQALEKALDRTALRTGCEAFTGAGHDVEFRDVHFAYKGTEVLKGVSFTAKEGQLTALVGASGSGKSTLAKLLAHFYDVSGGSISIGGQDIRHMSPDALDGEVSYVSQELFLFNKSILENIRVGRKGATDEEVREAARKACCDEFILELEDGYDTSAGKAGNMLSGGQKQRIAFARAILKDAPIIVLDEATAFVDPENEARMNDAIKEIIKNKTVIVIAHKLRSVAGADQLVLLEGGKAAACGTHQELLAASAGYRKLWEASESSGSWSLKGKEAEK
jgi:energy-coupling factor transport system ATP-binding protein